MNPRNILWWIFFIFCSLIVQKYIQGIDILIIGFIILLQEQDIKQIICITPFLLLTQESISTFAFGAVFLWYLTAIFLLFLSKWLFEIENFLFMFLFSSCFSFAQVGIYILMARLQGITFDMTALLDMSVIQALIMPLIWKFIVLIRPVQTEEKTVI